MKICDLIMKMEADSAREALLIAIAAGQSSLVKALLVGFDHFQWQEDIGEPFQEISKRYLQYKLIDH